MFRVGSARYADRGTEPSFGLSTLRPDHVTSRGGCAVLQFTGKAGIEHSGAVDDGEVCAVLRDLKRRRRGEQRLFAYWDPTARQWHEVDADEINDYLRDVSGQEMTAKDFRTWHGTVTAAKALARSAAKTGPRPTKARRKRAVSTAMKEVADALGNTPTVARGSYVDPRVVEAYESGVTIDERKNAEREVRDLLAGV